MNHFTAKSKIEKSKSKQRKKFCKFQIQNPNQSQEIHRLQTNNSNRGSKMDVSNDFAAEDLFGGEYLYYATMVDLNLNLMFCFIR